MLMLVYLTGYRGTGKTSVGEILSDELKIPLIDLDVQIESEAGKSIREIFEEGGEELFRDYESRELQRAANRDSSVISLGGGAVLRPTNRDLIRQRGVCVWLDATPETLAVRIAGDATSAARRPSLTELSPLDEVTRLMRDRESLYREIASHKIQTENKTIAAVAAEIIEFLASDRSIGIAQPG